MIQTHLIISGEKSTNEIIELPPNVVVLMKCNDNVPDRNITPLAYLWALATNTNPQLFFATQNIMNSNNVQEVIAILTLYFARVGDILNNANDKYCIYTNECPNVVFRCVSNPICGRYQLPVSVSTANGEQITSTDFETIARLNDLNNLGTNVSTIQLENSTHKDAKRKVVERFLRTRTKNEYIITSTSSSKFNNEGGNSLAYHVSALGALFGFHVVIVTAANWYDKVNTSARGYIMNEPPMYCGLNALSEKLSKYILELVNSNPNLSIDILLQHQGQLAQGVLAVAGSEEVHRQCTPVKGYDSTTLSNSPKVNNNKKKVLFGVGGGKVYATINNRKYRVYERDGKPLIKAKI